mgnify:CR=1 FL=1
MQSRLRSRSALDADCRREEEGRGVPRLEERSIVSQSHTRTQPTASRSSSDCANECKPGSSAASTPGADQIGRSSHRMQSLKAKATAPLFSSGWAPLYGDFCFLQRGGSRTLASCGVHSTCRLIRSQRVCPQPLGTQKARPHRSPGALSGPSGDLPQFLVYIALITETYNPRLTHAWTLNTSASKSPAR